MIVFFDTNVLIYQYDLWNTEHRNVANALFRRCAESEDIDVVLSVQVLGEFFSAITRKGPVPMDKRRAIEEAQRFREFQIVETDVSLVERAMLRSARSQINYYDALIVEAALTGGADVLYSQDMQHGMRYDSMRVENPFEGLPAAQ